MRARRARGHRARFRRRRAQNPFTGSSVGSTGKPEVEAVVPPNLKFGTGLFEFITGSRAGSSTGSTAKPVLPGTSPEVPVNPFSVLDFCVLDRK